MDFSPKQLTNYKFLKLFLKVAVSAACLWYVFTKIDFSEVISAVKKANGWWLIAGFIIYTISKFLGAKRLNIYFKNIDIHLPEWQNIKLYWLGMFYNLFLPGAITGDAYKVLLLSKGRRSPCLRAHRADCGCWRTPRCVSKSYTRPSHR